MNSFYHLHLHSVYSFYSYEGLSSLEDTLEKSGTAVLHLVRVPFLSVVKRCLSIISEKQGIGIDLIIDIGFTLPIH